MGDVYNNPVASDAAFISKLKYQNSVFSAFKSANQTTSLQHLRIARKHKSFSDFKKEALSITEDYNKTWLTTEFRACKMRCRTAKNFRQALKDADLYPNIKYLPSTASDPREAHKPYYGIILPVGHAFWFNHLAPLDWNCQCGWTTTDEPATGMPNEFPEPAPGLDENPGVTGAIFSQSHNYFKEAAVNATAILKDNVAAINGLKADDLVYFFADKKTNGVVYSFDKLAQEHAVNTKTGQVYAKMGNDVRLFGYDKIDSRINGVWNEFKNSTGKPVSVDNLIRTANRQFKARKLKGDITINLDAGFKKGDILNGLKNRFRRLNDNRINNVHFISGNKYLGMCTVEDVMNDKLPF